MDRIERYGGIWRCHVAPSLRFGTNPLWHPFALPSADTPIGPAQDVEIAQLVGFAFPIGPQSHPAATITSVIRPYTPHMGNLCKLFLAGPYTAVAPERRRVVFRESSLRNGNREADQSIRGVRSCHPGKGLPVWESFGRGEHPTQAIDGDSLGLGSGPFIAPVDQELH